VAAKDGTTKFKDLSNTDQEEVCTKAKERYISYVFLQQSGKQHNKLKVDLQNNFTTGDDRYHKNHQQTLHLLDHLKTESSKYFYFLLTFLWTQKVIISDIIMSRILEH
jgi:hypothetical protein